MDNEKQVPEEFGKVKKKRMNRGVKALIIVLSVIIGIAVTAVAAFFIMRAIGKAHFSPAIMQIEDVAAVSDAVAYDEGKTVKYGGKTYVFNEDVIYIAFMGIDKPELGSEEGVAHSAGQNDANMILAVDTKSGKMSLIVIPRDSMADVAILDENGKRVSTSRIQLCLAYAYGDGKETSCKNATDAMERLLYGISIDNYYSLDLWGIPALNDAVGGVEVTCLETIKNFCNEGEVKLLRGHSARIYVQQRDTTTFNSDAKRRQRQIQYAKAFAAKALSEMKADFSVATDLWSIASDYACTNFDITHYTYLVSVILDSYDTFSFSDDNIYVLPGEAKMGKTYMEVELDREEVFKTILKVFYKEAE